MTGSIVPLDGGRYETVRYSETLYDEAHGNTVVMHSNATCTVFRAAPAAVVAQPASAPVIAAPAPAPAGAGPQSIIALVSSDGGFSETVPVGMRPNRHDDHRRWRDVRRDHEADRRYADCIRRCSGGGRRNGDPGRRPNGPLAARPDQADLARQLDRE
jgi:hypothetical protein